MKPFKKIIVEAKGKYLASHKNSIISNAQFLAVVEGCTEYL